MHDGVNYELLEKIKNGRIVAAKFDSKELKFKTPGGQIHAFCYSRSGQPTAARLAPVDGHH